MHILSLFLELYTLRQYKRSQMYNSHCHKVFRHLCSSHRCQRKSSSQWLCNIYRHNLFLLRCSKYYWSKFVWKCSKYRYNLLQKGKIYRLVGMRFLMNSTDLVGNRHHHKGVDLVESKRHWNRSDSVHSNCLCHNPFLLDSNKSH